ncbi:MAG: hypothetical protein OEU26_03150 [Candidatus Tectomicrobia bacterium]|nr:hypothetical protein [Candidatus Tectomicrobia bacterium]
MPEENNTTAITLKLHRLWKGTLYIGITGIYVFLLGVLLIYQGWRSTLLVSFLIGLGQWFRYIASDVDRLGWIMSKNEPSEEETKEKKYQVKMLILLFSLIQFLNIAIIYQTYATLAWMWALVVTLAIMIIEIMFGHIRSVNRRIDYDSASYGIKDYGPLTTGAITPKHREIDEKLAKLKHMAEEGEISQKAYEKARDRVLIERIMQG